MYEQIFGLLLSLLPEQRASRDQHLGIGKARHDAVGRSVKLLRAI
jgi:hypothetical protein